MHIPYVAYRNWSLPHAVDKPLKPWTRDNGNAMSCFLGHRDRPVRLGKRRALGATWKFVDPSVAGHAAPIDGAVRTISSNTNPRRSWSCRTISFLQRRRHHAQSQRSLRSAKSLLSALFGIAIERGQVDIENTLDRLGVDDIAPSLTPQEKQATVRQLLMARSGVYHQAVARLGSRDRRVRHAEPIHLVHSGTTTIGTLTHFERFTRKQRVTTPSRASKV